MYLQYDPMQPFHSKYSAPPGPAPPAPKAPHQRHKKPKRPMPVIPRPKKQQETLGQHIWRDIKGGITGIGHEIADKADLIHHPYKTIFGGITCIMNPASCLFDVAEAGVRGVAKAENPDTEKYFDAFDKYVKDPYNMYKTFSGGYRQAKGIVNGARPYVNQVRRQMDRGRDVVEGGIRHARRAQRVIRGGVRGAQQGARAVRQGALHGVRAVDRVGGPGRIARRTVRAARRGYAGQQVRRAYDEAEQLAPPSHRMQKFLDALD